MLYDVALSDLWWWLSSESFLLVQWVAVEEDGTDSCDESPRLLERESGYVSSTVTALSSVDGCLNWTLKEDAADLDANLEMPLS